MKKYEYFLQLTVLFVQQDFELILNMVFECVVQSIDGSFVSQFAVHETDATRLLHYFSSIVARRLTEGLIAIDDGKIHDLSISEDKATVS